MKKKEIEDHKKSIFYLKEARRLLNKYVKFLTESSLEKSILEITIVIEQKERFLDLLLELEK